jgi:hypothetical protein
MHLPAEVRRALGMTGPTQVVLTIDDDAVRPRTPAQNARAHPQPRPPL